MAESFIPVDLFNPGQVFACLGFLEAADLLIGDAEGGFDWSDTNNACFLLHAAGDADPISTIFDAVTTSKIECWAPTGYADPATSADQRFSDSAEDEAMNPSLIFSESFPSASANLMELPIRLRIDQRLTFNLTHWTDGSSRETFKLYAGNRSAFRIAQAMLFGTRYKPTKKQSVGDLKTKGIAQLWHEQRDALIKRPFDVVTPMGGSFNFDPRGAWTAIDAGYSPNDQKHRVAASPVVEFFAALGLEHARPYEYQTRKVRYAAWGSSLPTMMARPALSGISALPMRRFRFELAMSGKNKVTTFSEEEIQP